MIPALICAEFERLTINIDGDTAFLVKGTHLDLGTCEDL